MTNEDTLLEIRAKINSALTVLERWHEHSDHVATVVKELHSAVNIIDKATNTPTLEERTKELGEVMDRINKFKFISKPTYPTQGG